MSGPASFLRLACTQCAVSTCFPSPAVRATLLKLMLMPIPVWPSLMLSLLMLRQIQGCDLVNFEMAYEELRGIQLGSGSSRGDEQYKWGRGTALRSFQGLLLSGIVAQVSDGVWGEKAAE